MGAVGTAHFGLEIIMSATHTPVVTEAIYRAFVQAIEIGRWPDGRRLSEQQRELCMQAIIEYDLQHNPEHQRIGFIDKGAKAKGELCDDDTQVLRMPGSDTSH